MPEDLLVEVPQGTQMEQCRDCRALSAGCGRPGFFQSARCHACGARLHLPDTSWESRAAVFLLATAAAVLLPFALQEPMLSIHRPGGVHLSGFVDGIHKLWRLGNWPLAIFVGLFSGVFPVVKVVMLLIVSVFPRIRRSHRRAVLLAIHFTASLSVLDVVMVGVVAITYVDMMAVKVTLEPAVNLFLLMGLCLILAGYLSLRAEGR